MQVMLLGHSDSYTRDKQMQVTIAYNHFGEGLIQRMPRYCWTQAHEMCWEMNGDLTPC